jgi:hypothetical protein
MSRGAVRAVFRGGLLCGVLDLTAAIVQYGLRGVPPIRIMQSIAAGLLGADAFKGGAATATLGTALHFLIAFTAAAVYYGASRHLRWMVTKAVPAGAAFGVAVYFFMNYIVLPLSRFPVRAFNLENFVIGLIIHVLFVGLPVALAVRSHSTTQ